MRNLLAEQLLELDPLERVALMAEKAFGPHAEERRELATALAFLPQQFAVPVTIAVLAEDDSPKVRAEARKTARLRFESAPRRYGKILGVAGR